MSMFQGLFEVEKTDRNDFWEGRALRANEIAAGLYLAVAFGALIVFGLFADETKLVCLKPWQRLLIIGIGILVSAGPPAWFWIEARAFDYWVNRKFDDDTSLSAKRLRETFKINADNEKAFWAAIVAVYAAVLLKW